MKLVRSVLFDASVYIDALRSGDFAFLSAYAPEGDVLLWLSAVVLEELYAGASGSNLRTVESLEASFTSLGRVLVPNHAEWVQAGRLLAKLATKYGHEQIGRGRLTNDALIALSAARLGIVVVTRNARDFVRIAEFCLFKWEAV